MTLWAGRDLSMSYFYGYHFVPHSLEAYGFVLSLLGSILFYTILVLHVDVRFYY